MWQSRIVSVVFPAYNEKSNIRRAVEDFFSSGFVDEIVVVDNNSSDGTSVEAAAAGARVVPEPRQGYGAALRRGLVEASGNLIILAEPDGTFAGADVRKLLELSHEFDMVCGTRTNTRFIQDGARMGFAIRWGNVLLAALLATLFRTGRLTDCGCTLRLVHRDALDLFAHDLTVTGSHFLPEMVILARLHGVSMTEIPVTYRKRVGESKITGSLTGAIRTGGRMLGLILSRRLALGSRGGFVRSSSGTISRVEQERARSSDIPWR